MECRPKLLPGVCGALETIGCAPESLVLTLRLFSALELRVVLARRTRYLLVFVLVDEAPDAAIAVLAVLWLDVLLQSTGIPQYPVTP